MMKAIKVNNITKRAGGLIVTTSDSKGKLNIYLDKKDVKLFYKDYIIVDSEIATRLRDVNGYDIPDRITRKSWKNILDYLGCCSRGSE